MVKYFENGNKELLKRVLRVLKNVYQCKDVEKMKDKEDRTCHYTTVIALVKKDFEKTFEYTLDGNLTYEVRGDNGFGFDEIFELDNGKTLAEISTEEKFLISPRKKALEKIEEYITNVNL